MNFSELDRRVLAASAAGLAAGLAALVGAVVVGGSDEAAPVPIATTAAPETSEVPATSGTVTTSPQTTAPSTTVADTTTTIAETTTSTSTTIADTTTTTASAETITTTVVETITTTTDPADGSMPVAAAFDLPACSDDFDGLVVVPPDALGDTADRLGGLGFVGCATEIRSAGSSGPELVIVTLLESFADAEFDCDVVNQLPDDVDVVEPDLDCDDPDNPDDELETR